MTIELFCSTTWNLSYSEVLNSISKDDYSEFEIPKKNGKRTITSISKDSKMYTLQKLLNCNFIDKQITPVCVKGFKKGENYLSYLEEHIGSEYFLRLDITDFFPSITKENIKKELFNVIVCEEDEEKQKIADLISDIVTFEDVLPQGAPSSPGISNIFMTRIDQRILKYCQVFDISYTRYADDLLFSSKSFDFKDKKWFIKKIKHILSSQGLKLNYNKIKYGNDEISLNGYVISKNGLRISRGRIWDIRHVLSFAKDNIETLKNDKNDFLVKLNCLKLRHRNLEVYPFNTVFQFLQYLCGYRAFLLSFLNFELETNFKKNLLKLVKKIEKIISKYVKQI